MTQSVKLGEVVALPKGSPLVANAAGGDATLTIDYAGDFAAGGGTLVLNGVEQDYSSITEGAAQYDPDTVNLVGTLANAASIGDWVGIFDGGQELVDYVAVCATDDGDEIQVPITDLQVPFYQVGVYDPPVAVFVSDDLQRLESSPGRTPAVTGIVYRTASTGERAEMQVTGVVNGVPQLALYTDNAHEDPELPSSVYAQDLTFGSTSTIITNVQGAGTLDDSGIATGLFPLVSLESRFDSTTDTASTSASITAELIQLNGPVSTTETFAAPGSFQSGVESSPSGAANVVRSIAVTFATPFAVAPVVTATIAVAASVARVRAWVDPTSVTTVGCDIYALREDNSGPYDVHWQATAPTQ